MPSSTPAITDKIAQLTKSRAALIALERSVEKEIENGLAALPAQFGFDSVAAFVKAVKRAAKGAKSAGLTPRKSAKSAKSTKRTRVKMTDEIRAKVKTLVKSGKTGAEIAKEVGISIATVHNTKKALGLVRKK